jgi:hypothetical protein
VSALDHACGQALAVNPACRLAGRRGGAGSGAQPLSWPPSWLAPGLVALPLPPGILPGSYVVFIAVIAAGALEDGRLDPGDLLAVGTATFALLP